MEGVSQVNILRTDFNEFAQKSALFIINIYQGVQRRGNHLNYRKIMRLLRFPFAVFGALAHRNGCNDKRGVFQRFGGVSTEGLQLSTSLVINHFSFGTYWEVLIS